MQDHEDTPVQPRPDDWAHPLKMCAKSRKNKPSARGMVIQYYQCQRFGHKTNECSQEARRIGCGGNDKLINCTFLRDTSKDMAVKCSNTHGNDAAV